MYMSYVLDFLLRQEKDCKYILISVFKGCEKDCKYILISI